ncbi:hypothetical protein, partial [Mesorhizobium sp. M2A.F.Ca.ET.039.01.1.1]|uniref:hypothetical protein n=1 Tax=Mesorhizobium sp. M2A.F.Ca.ET.039.01.1.1 TaxID=2496746 RepID=UPI001AECA6BD
QVGDPLLLILDIKDCSHRLNLWRRGGIKMRPLERQPGRPRPRASDFGADRSCRLCRMHGGHSDIASIVLLERMPGPSLNGLS